MADSQITIALATLGAALVAAMGPIISIIFTSRMRSKELEVQSKIRRDEKEQDYERQDAVAEAAKNAAERMIARQDAVAAQAAKAAKLLLDAQAETTQQNVETQGKLNQIHTLVNSNLTKEMEDRLVALKGQVYLTKEIIRLNRSNHIEPNSETQASLHNLEATVSNLETALKERGTATDRADLEQT